MYLRPFVIQTIIHKMNERKSRAQILALQQRKFRKLVRYAQKKSPYWAEVIRTHNINVDNCKPEDFPVLYKKDIIENFDRFVTDRNITTERISDFLSQSVYPQELYAGKYLVVHSSGSSGRVAFYVYTIDEWVKGAVIVSRGLFDYKLGRRFAYLGTTRGHYAGISLAGAAARLPFLYSKVAAFDINDPFYEILEGMNDFQPHVITGYANIIKYLAIAQKNGHLKIKPEIIYNSGETMTFTDKQFVESVFGIEVTNMYITSENSFMGVGSYKYNGMYLADDNFIFELHPDHLCVTNLYNLTMPLIRYHMDDILIPETQTPPGPIQLPFTRVKNVVGRVEHSAAFRNQNGQMEMMHPISFASFYVKGVVGFQVKVLDENSFRFEVVLTPGLSPVEKGNCLNLVALKMREILLQKKLSNVHFEVVPVEHLQVDPKTGKFHIIVDEKSQAPSDLATVAGGVGNSNVVPLH